MYNAIECNSKLIAALKRVDASDHGEAFKSKLRKDLVEFYNSGRLMSVEEAVEVSKSNSRPCRSYKKEECTMKKLDFNKNSYFYGSAGEFV